MLHLGLQVVVVGVLVGPQLAVGGDALFGLDQQFSSSHAVVGVVSTLLSLIILCVSHVSCQENVRLSRDLPTPSHTSLYMTTSIIYLLSTTIISSVSTLLLCILLYVDTESLTASSWLILPILLLSLHPLLQTILYNRLVKESCEQRFSWGVFAAVTPVRFLHSERRSAARFLLISQLVWFLVHTLAWIIYSVYSLLVDQSDAVFRVWLPIIVPLLLISPLVTSLHWSLSLAPVYSSPHAHPDMGDLERRHASFPPDWRTISGCQLSVSSLAEAGFFYSCRRLTTGEATNYSSGRQISDWSNIKTLDPPTEESKPDLSSVQSKTNVSCFAEFVFIASTLLFRIASFAMLLWVFMVGTQLFCVVLLSKLINFFFTRINGRRYLISYGL